VLSSHHEQLSDHPRSFADELLDQLGAGDANEGALGVVGDGTSEQGFSGARWSVEQDTFGLSDAEGVEELWMPKLYNFFFFVTDCAELNTYGHLFAGMNICG